MFQRVVRRTGRVTVAMGAGMVLGFAGISSSSADVIISEVMYNPYGNNQFEYLELYNRSDNEFDLTGWEIQRSANVGTVDSGVLPAGGVAVLLRIDDARTRDRWDSAWGEDINFVETSNWPILTTGGATVTIRDDTGNTMAQMFYGVEEPWPEGEASGDGGWSIAIGDDPYRADWDAPDNWVRSVEGELGAWRADSPRENDIGSPGFVIPEPASAALLGLLGGSLLWRRRR